MKTEEQEISESRLNKYVEREQLLCVMSDSKWSHLFKGLKKIENKLDFKRRDVRDPEGINLSWDSDLSHVLAGWKSIEWLQIRAQLSIRRGALLEPTIEDYTDELIGIVKGIGVPYSKTEDGIQIWGYVRPGVHPEWE